MSSPILPEALALDAADAVQGTPARHARCRNCESPLSGPYCAHCGQYDAPPDPTLHELLADAWESLTNVDGKVLKTLRVLLTHPGELTREYLAGRRASYLPPFRIYLLCSVAYFVLSSIDVDRPLAPEQRREAAASDSVARTRIARGETRDVLGGTNSALERRLKRGNDRLEASGRKMDGVIRENIPNAMFVIVPAYALLLNLLYRSRRRRFPAHLVFALHVHAFFFAVLAVSTAVEHVVELGVLPEVIDSTISLATLAGATIYFPVAMRRVYGGRWRPTLLRAMTLAMAYGILTLALLAVATVGYLWILGA